MPETFYFVRGQLVNVTQSPASNIFTGNMPGGLSFSSSLNGSSYFAQVTGTVNAPAGTYQTSFATFIISDPNPLDPPVISCAEAILSNGVNVATVGAGAINLQFAASNSGSNWQASLPSGCGINSFGHVSGTLSPGSYSIVVQCQNYAWTQNDYTHGPAQITTYALTLVVIPALPVVTLNSNYYGPTWGGNYTVGDDMPNGALFSVQDYARPVTWTATGLPDGVNINPTSGYVTGKLTAPGEYNVTVEATNSTGSGTFAQTIIVAANQNVPVVTLSAQQPGYTGQDNGYGQTRPLAFEVGAAAKIFFDTTNDPASWTAADLPLGLTIDPDTGVVSGLIRVPGSYRFFVTATNDVGSSEPLGVTVTATGSAQAFQFVSDDPSLTDVQIDIRTGIVTSSLPQAFKQLQRVRLALVFLDYGAPVDPPDPADVLIGIRKQGMYDGEYLFPSPAAELVPADQTHPAYLLAEYTVNNPDINGEIIDAIGASLQGVPAPVVNAMAEVAWKQDQIQRISKTFTQTYEPAITDTEN
jgi:hypothetical protein